MVGNWVRPVPVVEYATTTVVMLCVATVLILGLFLAFMIDTIPSVPLSLVASIHNVSIETVEETVTVLPDGITWEFPQPENAILPLPIDLSQYGGVGILTSTRQVCDPTIEGATRIKEYATRGRMASKVTTNPACWNAKKTEMLTAAIQHGKRQGVFPSQFCISSSYYKNDELEQIHPNRRMRMVNHKVCGVCAICTLSWALLTSVDDRMTKTRRRRRRSSGVCPTRAVRTAQAVKGVGLLRTQQPAFQNICHLQ
jgi:hypothetical protein